MAAKNAKVKSTLEFLGRLKALVNEALDPSSPMNVTDRRYVALEGLRMVFHLVANSQLEIPGVRKLRVLAGESLTHEERILSLLANCVSRLEKSIQEKGIGSDGQEAHPR